MNNDEAVHYRDKMLDCEARIRSLEAELEAAVAWAEAAEQLICDFKTATLLGDKYG